MENFSNFTDLQLIQYYHITSDNDCCIELYNRYKKYIIQWTSTLYLLISDRSYEFEDIHNSLFEYFLKAVKNIKFSKIKDKKVFKFSIILNNYLKTYQNKLISNFKNELTLKTMLKFHTVIRYNSIYSEIIIEDFKETLDDKLKFYFEKFTEYKKLKEIAKEVNKTPSGIYWYKQLLLKKFKTFLENHPLYQISKETPLIFT